VKERITRHRTGDPKSRGATDWDRLARMSDAEVEAAALDDPDAQPMTERELGRMFRPRQLAEFRKRMGMSQAQFAATFHLNLRTLQDWEQGRREPEDIARAYLRVITRHPDAVTDALKD
jgi:putative transcriptional regulator